VSENVALLQEALAALTRYFVGDDRLGASLHRVAELAKTALPQTDHVGITLLVDGKPKTAVFTDPAVPEIDQAQYRIGDGPCLDAFRTGRANRITSTVEPGPWQAFRDTAAAHGVRSTVSIPLTATEGPLGALNLYAGSVDAFSDDDVAMASTFAAQAAFVLANAQAYWDTRDLSENRQQAMVSRATIEQAKGIIISSSACTPEQAMQLLIEQSQHENVKVGELAAQIVANAVRAR